MAPRKTRTAMRAETIHIDDTSTIIAAEIPLPPTPKGDRAPLGDITPNSVDGADSVPAADEEVALKKAKPKAKKGKPGKKGVKKPAAEDDSAGKEANGRDEESEVVPEVLEDERKAAGSPASDAAVEELMNESAGNITQVPMLDERPVSPPKAVRMTRRQLPKAEEEAAKEQFKQSVYEPAVEYLASEAQEEDRTAPVHEMKDLRLQDNSSISQAKEPSAEAVPATAAVYEASEDPTVSSSESKIEDSSSVPQSVSRTPANPTMRPEDSIAAIDALEDAIEEVGKTLSPLQISTSPEKQRKAKAPAGQPRTKTRPSTVAKTPKARPSVVKKAPASAAKTEQRKESSVSSAAATRAASSVCQSSGPSRSTSTGASSVKPSTAANDTSSKPAPIDYLASKRRPISLSFPTPPPPPKSSKPPTKPTFQLPGEAVAAKLRAAREERMKKEEEEAPKKREFKARPVRQSVAPIAVKQTAASKARRQSLMHGGESTGEEKENKGVTIQPLKRTSSIATNVNGKRQSTLAAKRTSAVVTKAALASTSKGGQEATSSDKPTAATVRSRPSSLHVPKAQPAATTKRVPSTASSTTPNTSAARTSSNPVSQTASTSAPGPAPKSTATAKGKEVFNRDKVEKEEMERRRREKEDAARKARAAAAERGRLASREWAERQKARKASGAGTVKAKEEVKEGAKEVSAAA